MWEPDLISLAIGIITTYILKDPVKNLILSNGRTIKKLKKTNE